MDQGPHLRAKDTCWVLRHSQGLPRSSYFNLQLLPLDPSAAPVTCNPNATFSLFSCHSFTQSNKGDWWAGPFLSVSLMAPWFASPWSRVWRGEPRSQSQKARLPPGLVWVRTARPSPGHSASRFIRAPSGVDFSAVAPGGSWPLVRPPPVPCSHPSHSHHRVTGWRTYLSVVGRGPGRGCALRCCDFMRNVHYFCV